MKQIAKEIIDQIVEELYSQKIFSNLTRPLYVEKLLARLLKGDWRHVGGDWSGWESGEFQDAPTHRGQTVGSQADVEQRSHAKAESQRSPSSTSRSAPDTTPTAAQNGSRRKAGRPTCISSLGIPASTHWTPSTTLTWSSGNSIYCQRRAYRPGQKSIALTSLIKLNPVCASYIDIADKVEGLVSQLQPLKWTLTSPAD